jgi:hypothetical protein
MRPRTYGQSPLNQSAIKIEANTTEANSERRKYNEISLSDIGERQINL